MESDNEINLGPNQFFSVFLLTSWVFFISFSSFQKNTADIAVFATFVPVAIVASCFWFDHLKSGFALFLASILLFGFTTVCVKYYQFDRSERCKVYKAKKAKRKFRKLKKVINKHRLTFKQYPNPTTSGNLQTTKLGSNTLQKVLSRHKSKTPLYYKFPNAHLSKGLDASFVCVVTKYSEFQTNQFKYQNCILDHNTQIPDTYKQGYVYHPKSGNIRYNFKVKRVKRKKGFFNFLNHWLFSR
jgi:hypothetical protein